MSVRKNLQSEHRFTILDIILKMYDHTATLIANDKIFDRKYILLINRIESNARLIYHYCRSANEDYDNRKKDEAEIRLNLEDKAIECCKWLKTDIRLAQKIFHLRAKKVIYWNSLVNESLEAIKKWKASEKKLYRENHGL